MPQKKLANWQDRFVWSVLTIALIFALLPQKWKLKVGQPLGTGLLLPLRGIATLRSNITISNRENRRLSRLAVELALENARLRSLLRTQENTSTTPSLSLIRASIIARDITTLKRYLILSRGSLDGIHTGAAVMAAEGVIGRIIATASHQALVQTLFEPDFRIAVTNIRSRELTIARADPKGTLLLDYVPLDADFQVGDSIITSGLGGIFPKGLRVGVVTEIANQPNGMFKLVFVRPMVDIGRLEHVFVLGVPETLRFQDSWLDNLSPQELTVPE